MFGRTISTHFGTVSSLSMFSVIQLLFLQKTKPSVLALSWVFFPQKLELFLFF